MSMQVSDPRREAAEARKARLARMQRPIASDGIPIPPPASDATRIGILERTVEDMLRRLVAAEEQIEEAGDRDRAYQETIADLQKRVRKAEALGNAAIQPDVGRHGQSTDLGLADVIALVCETTGVAPKDIIGQTRNETVAGARYLVMALAYHHTKMGLAEIGAKLGNRAPATVSAGIQAIDTRIAEDPEFATKVETLAQMLDEVAGGDDA